MSQPPRPEDSEPVADETEQLVLAAQAGDNAALELLLLRYGPVVRSFLRLKGGPTARRRESDSDLLQDVFCVAIEALADFDYRGVGSFRNWLLACAHNVLRGQRRKAQAMKRDIGREVSATLLGEGGDACLATVYAHIATPSRHAVAREQIAILEVAFDRLSQRDQEVILLHRIHGLSHLEVSERLGISHAAARQALHQALMRLTRFMEQAGG